MLIKLRENAWQIGFDRTSLKSNSLFRRREIFWHWCCVERRLWAPTRVEANQCGGIQMKRNFPPSGDAPAGRITTLVIFDEGTFNHHRYIKEVLPVVNEWTFQQHLTLIILLKNGGAIFMNKDHCPSNSRALNSFDYSIWDQLADGMDSTQISLTNCAKLQSLWKLQHFHWSFVANLEKSCKLFIKIVFGHN